MEKTSSPDRFLSDYLDMIYRHDSGTVASWLIYNASNMTEAMFMDDKLTWISISPVHILFLRACAPSKVFTKRAKEKYIECATGSEHFLFADALFGTDQDLVEKLPAGCENIKPQLIELMQLVYRAGIRPFDAVVRAM